MFGKALMNAFERGAPIIDKLPDRDFAGGGESSKASDKDSDEDTVGLETASPNLKGGS